MIRAPAPEGQQPDQQESNAGCHPTKDNMGTGLFRIAQQRRKLLTLVDKANVLPSMAYFRSIFDAVAGEFPDVQTEHCYIDTATLFLVQQPHRFDVIVTENMFGDILTDEASVLAGSMGMLPSASLRAGGPGLYEPIHGSAPDIAGKGIANPLGTMLSGALLLRYSLKLEAEAAVIETAKAWMPRMSWEHFARNS